MLAAKGSYFPLSELLSKVAVWIIDLLWKFFNVRSRRVIFEDCQQTSSHETVRPSWMTVHRNLSYRVINPESC